MRVMVEFFPDDSVYKVVRVKELPDTQMYLTANGWKEKLAGEPVVWDDTMLWTEGELESFVDEAKQAITKKRS